MNEWPPSGGEDAILLRAAADAFLPARRGAAAPVPVGVAVSGGGDSMALLHLLHRVAPHVGFALHAITVDHGLRPEAAAEAAGVAAFCAGLGIPHDTLRWRGPQATGNLMDQARRARLLLIAQWARARGIDDVALGHTADDQAETFLMNLARAAGLDGLCGMRPGWAEHGIRWNRPLWQQTRKGLRDYLRRNGLAWIDDPSNDDDRFTRVRARRVLKAMKPLGITVERILASTTHLAQARGGLQSALARLADADVTEQAGALSLPPIGPELERRLLIHAIRWMNGADYPPRSEQILRLITALAAGRDATLGGVQFRRRGERITIIREPRAVMGPVPFGGIWDHRWRVEGPAEPAMTIAALGAEGLRRCPGWRDHGPRAALIVSPAVWHGTDLVAAPLAGEGPGWSARLEPTFRLFILAH